MLTDDDGQRLYYWPISGLKAGMDSQTITVWETDPQEGMTLGSTNDPNVKVMGRKHGTADPFLDLSLTAIPMTGMPAPAGFDIYVHAEVTITEALRIPLSVGSVTQNPAAWL